MASRRSGAESDISTADESRAEMVARLGMSERSSDAVLPATVRAVSPGDSGSFADKEVIRTPRCRIVRRRAQGSVALLPEVAPSGWARAAC